MRNENKYCNYDDFECVVVEFDFVGFSVGYFEWYRFVTLPLFLNQLINAYEGIGCVCFFGYFRNNVISICFIIDQLGYLQRSACHLLAHLT